MIATPLEPARFNLAQHLLDGHVARGHGDDLAILTLNGEYSYANLLALTRRAAALLKRTGVDRGDRVLIALDDGVDFVTALLGSLRMGGVATMANPALPREELRALAAFVGARVVVAGAGFATAGDAWTTFCDHEGDDLAGSWSRALADAPAGGEAAATAADAPAMWLFSSGSTGRPKAAVHSHRALAAHIDCYARPILDMGPRDRVLCVPRLHFPYATGLGLFFPFAVGAATVLTPGRPTAEDLAGLIDRFAPTILTTVPTMTAKLLALADARPGWRPSSLRLAISAGEALPAAMHTRFSDRFGIPMLDGIGSAELFHIYVSNRADDARPGCVGTPVPGYEVRIVREDGQVAAPGETGVLWVRGPTVASGYHGDPERTAATFRDGWVVTGDMFSADADGYLYFHGRADDLLKVAGLYVSPLEVEAVLAEHDAVAECAVTGFKDPQGLVKPRAFVVLRDRQRAGERLFDDLGQHCRARLLGYKVPRAFVVVDALPRNDRGKLMRKALRDSSQ
jgi:benzoate-CoA ligase family protein